MEPSSNWLGYKIFILGIGVRFPLVLQRINDDTRSDQPSGGEKFPAIGKIIRVVSAPLIYLDL